MIMFVCIGVALLITGITIGILAVVAIGVHREEKASSLTIDSLDKLTSGTRAANGVYARIPGIAQRPTPPSSDRLALAGHGPRF